METALLNFLCQTCADVPPPLPPAAKAQSAGRPLAATSLLRLLLSVLPLEAAGQNCSQLWV